MEVRPEAFYSFGMEIEFNSPVQKTVSRRLSALKLDAHIVYDASAETNVPIESVTGLPISGDTELMRKNTRLCGGEFVTGIWNNRDKKSVFDRLLRITNELKELGEENKSNTAGIHFHQSFPLHLDSLQNVLTIFSHLEKFMFSVGGMGYEHRGMRSDSVYYRPITSEGPLVVPVPYGWAQCFSIESLQSAKSVEEFFQRYGDITGTQQGERYPVVRYHWLNLVNMTKKQGTIESRVYNKTLDPARIWAMLQLFLHLGEYAFRTTKKQLVKDGFAEEQSVFQPLQEPLSATLNRIFVKTNFPDKKATQILIDLCENSKEAILLPRLVRSHLHDRHRVTELWTGLTRIPEQPLSPPQINHPIYVDRYVARGEVDPQTRFTSFDQVRSESVRTRDWRATPLSKYKFSVRGARRKARKKPAVQPEAVPESWEDAVELLTEVAVPTMNESRRTGTGTFTYTMPTYGENREMEDNQ